MNKKLPYNYIFTGDSVNLVEDQVSSAYVSVPFTVSGYTDSRINDLAFYGTPKFKLLVPVQKNNVELMQIFAGIMPFLGIVIFAMFLMYMFPGIALWLPETLFAD